METVFFLNFLSSQPRTDFFPLVAKNTIYHNKTKFGVAGRSMGTKFSTRVPRYPGTSRSSDEHGSTIRVFLQMGRFYRWDSVRIFKIVCTIYSPSNQIFLVVILFVYLQSYSSLEMTANEQPRHSSQSVMKIRRHRSTYYILRGVDVLFIKTYGYEYH